MNMSINKSGSQKYFEEMFTRVGSKPFRQIPKTQYEQTCITKNQADEFKRHLESEVASYYYKALLSYIEIAYGTLYGYSCSLQYAFNRV